MWAAVALYFRPPPTGPPSGMLSVSRFVGPLRLSHVGFFFGFFSPFFSLGGEIGAEIFFSTLVSVEWFGVCVCVCVC